MGDILDMDYAQDRHGRVISIDQFDSSPAAIPDAVGGGIIAAMLGAAPPFAEMFPPLPMWEGLETRLPRVARLAEAPPPSPARPEDAQDRKRGAGAVIGVVQKGQ